MFIATPGGEAVTYRYFPAGQGEAAHFECVIGENSLDYNDGPNDPVGPDSAAWDAFVGQYHIDQWGKRLAIDRPSEEWLSISEDQRLIEFEPNLFFTADGEAVDFRHPDRPGEAFALRSVPELRRHRASIHRCDAVTMQRLSPRWFSCVQQRQI